MKAKEKTSMDGQTLHQRSVQTIQKMERNLINNTVQLYDWETQAGRYIFPFDFYLPHSLPGSYDGAGVTLSTIIDYQIYVEFNVSEKVTFKKRIDVDSRHTRNSLIYALYR
jgi:hypothetical protein